MDEIPIPKNSFVRASDGFEGWVVYYTPMYPQDGGYGPYLAVVQGPMGTKKYRPEELKIVPRTDIPSK